MKYYIYCGSIKGLIDAPSAVIAVETVLQNQLKVDTVLSSTFIISMTGFGGLEAREKVAHKEITNPEEIEELKELYMYDAFFTIEEIILAFPHVFDKFNMKKDNNCNNCENPDCE